jgi:hypothetical protein
MNQNTIDYYLDIWKRWMHAPDHLRLGYKRKVSAFATGGINCWDDQEEEVDQSAAHSMDAIIGSLPDLQKLAIEMHCGLMVKVWASNRLDFDVLLTMAYRSIWSRLEQKGLI